MSRLNIVLKVFLFGYENNFYKSGHLSVLSSDFKKDPDWTAAIAAYEWIEEIKREIGYPNDFKIIKVVYNQENDITNLVLKVRPII